MTTSSEVTNGGSSSSTITTTATSPIQKELISLLGNDAADGTILSQLQTIMSTFSLSAEDLSYKWQSFSFNTGQTDMRLSLDNLRQLQEYIQQSLESQPKPKKIKTAHNTPSSVSRKTKAKMIGSSPNDLLESMMGTTTPSHKNKPAASSTQKSSQQSSRLHLTNDEENQNQYDATPSRDPVKPLPNHEPYDEIDPTTTALSFDTPIKPPSSRGLIGSSSPTPYSKRNKEGKLPPTLNPDIERALPRKFPPQESTVDINVNIDMKKFGFRTMYQKLTDIAETLDEQIENAISIILDAYELTDDQVSNPALSSQSDIIAVGRVVNEHESDKINMNSVLLESGRRIGGGMRARLNMENAKDFSLFPGKIIAVKGSNPEGDAFIVKEVLEMPLLGFSASPKHEIIAAQNKQSSKPLAIVVASGPYTTSDNLLFEPLTDLVQHINTTNPDAVILHGPFIDLNHPLIQSGDFDIPNPFGTTNDSIENATLDDLFKYTVGYILKQIRNPNLPVIIIPSVNDVTNGGHAAYPQPQLNRKALDLPKNFKCLSNPSTFALNDIVFSATSADSLADLIKSTVQPTTAKTSNRYIVAASNLISQRNLYPLYPSNSSLSVDVPYMRLADFPNALPDVILTPCSFSPLAHVVDNVVVVSPGLLAKGKSGGTFATMTIKPPPDVSDENDEAYILHKVWERSRVDFAKI